jgi:hypothetical protein
MMRVILSITVFLLLSGCKTRDPDAAGLLDDDTAPTSEPESTDDTPAPGGNWSLTCTPTELGTDTTYTLAINGAVSADETQTIAVSASELRGGTSTVIADHQLGHGAVPPAGPVFIGFSGGLLTTDAPNAKGVRPGVLTLARDQNAEGLKVSCQAVQAK